MAIEPIKNGQRDKLKRFLKEAGVFLLDILSNAVVIIILVVIIRSFIISPFRVIGSSMVDTLQSREFIIVNKLIYRLSEPKHDDIVVFLPPMSSKYDPKLEATLTTDANGAATLDVSGLKRPKEAFYCRTPLLTMWWFCQERAQANDWVYAQKIDLSNPGDPYAQKKRTVTAEEAKKKLIPFTGEPASAYKVSLYSATGPEYYIKRIIGLPGDTIKIEQGKVYRREKDATDFHELSEPYLNAENLGHTYPASDDASHSVFTVPEHSYFVIGDNRNYSNDSRHWISPIDREPTPFVHPEDISGKALLVLWPPQNMRIIKH